jgi:hypothetical protein
MRPLRERAIRIENESIWTEGAGWDDGRFYLGLNKVGAGMLIISIVGLAIFEIPTMGIAVIGVVEGVIYLTKLTRS